MSRATTKLWNDINLQAFNEELGNMLEDERLMVSGASVSRRMLDRSFTALTRMVEHHYELRHMHDIERRQIEEIDKIRERFKDSENKQKHLTNIKKALEETIDELTKELAFKRKESSDRQSTVELRVKQTDSQKSNMETDKKIAEMKLKTLTEKKDDEMKQVLEDISTMKVANAKMKAACEAAEKGTLALKNALAVCQDTLEGVAN